MKIGDLVKRHCRNCVYLRSTCTAETGFCTVYDRDTTLEDSCEHFANVAIKGIFSEIERLPNKETKGIHPEPIEDSLVRDLKKENTLFPKARRSGPNAAIKNGCES